jgi:hypothetical protein
VLSLLPSLPPLIQDSFPHVRSALSAVLPLLAPALGKDNTQAHLLPLLVSERASEQSEHGRRRSGGRAQRVHTKETLGRRCRCSRPPRSHKRRRSGRRAQRVQTKQDAWAPLPLLPPPRSHQRRSSLVRRGVSPRKPSCDPLISQTGHRLWARFARFARAHPVCARRSSRS